MGARIRAHDWSRSPLGPLEGWPQPLQTLVGVMLRAGQPMFLAWGPDRAMLYNDAYVGLLGRKHPAALGRPFLEVWAEAQADLTPLVDQVFAGSAVHMADIALWVDRDGGLDEAHFAFSYTPVQDGAGGVAGLFCACIETTAQVIAERRLRDASARAETIAVERSAILSQLAEGVIVTDRQGRIRFVNDAAAAMHGVARLDVEPEAYSETYHLFTEDGRPHPPLELPLARAVRGETVDDAGWVIRRPDGTEVLANGSARPLRDGSGEQIGALLTLKDETGRRSAERALRESEERLRLIVEGATDHAILTTDVEGRITSWSSGAAQIFDWSAAEVAGQSVALIFTPEDQESGAPARELAKARREGVADDERWHVRKDGGRVYMNGSVHPLHDAQGQDIGFLKIARDETERRRQAEAVRQSEEHYRNTVELNPQTVWTATPDGLLDNVGRRWLEWTGTTGLGASWGDVMHPDDRERSFKAWTASFTTGRTYDIEHRARMQGGAYHWMHSRAYPRRDGEGRIVQWYGTTEDIQARKLAEEAVRESEIRFRNMADNAPVMMWVTEPDGYCSYLNQGWYDFTGQSVEEALGLGWTKATHPDDQQMAEAAFLSANAAQGPFRIEYRLRRRDGAYRWAIDAATPRFGEDGAFLGYVGSVFDIDERREAELRLAVSEESLRLATDAAEVGTWDLDVAADVLTWSDRTKTMFGISPGAPCSMMDFYAGVFSDDRTVTNAAFGAALDPERRALYDVEYRTVGKEDGLIRWVAAKGKGVFDAQGRCIRAVGTAIDITERRARDQRLRESERLRLESDARFEAIADHVDQMIWSTTPDGFHDYYNQRWYDFTGVPQGSTDGAGWTALIHPDDRLDGRSLWAECLASGAPYRTEYRLRHHSGRYRWVLGRAQPVRDDDGDITRWYGTCTDIEDIVQAREVLARSRAELERLVEARTAERDRLWRLSQDMLARAGYDGTLAAVSPAWTQVLGYTEAQLLSRPYADIIDPDYLDVVTAALSSMRETGEPTRFVNRILAADGAWKWIEWTVAPEPGGVHFIAVGRDISDDKAREAELASAQEQLRQAQKMEAVGQLTGGIAHDFNNLLQGITGSLDLVQKRVAQGRFGELDRFISGAMTSANRAAALTHRLLAFSRRQPLDPKPVRPNALVTSMEDLLRRTMGEQIQLELVLAGGLWPTLCDPNQLESAILNLVINARDAMPDGGKLTIETCNAHLDDAYAARTRDVSPGQYVCIAVTDTGTGMPREVVERAFDPFFTTKPIGQGTGLGLSMIYGFARQSEGYCKIYSEVGQGTTIKLYLPRHRGAALDEEPIPSLNGAHAAEQGEVVVVVEDEPVVRGLIVEVLHELGYRALEAETGPAGLEVLDRTGRVDLLITDIGLPGMNGRQVADAARERRPKLKVLFMTGYAENAAIANGFLEPGMSMITKPFAIESLATRIREMIEAG